MQRHRGLDERADLEFAFRYFIVQVGDDELRTRALVASRADGGATSLTSRVGRFLRLAEPVVLPAATLGALFKVGVGVSIVPWRQITDIRPDEVLADGRTAAQSRLDAGRVGGVAQPCERDSNPIRSADSPRTDSPSIRLHRSRACCLVRPCSPCAQLQASVQAAKPCCTAQSMCSGSKLGPSVERRARGKRVGQTNKPLRSRSENRALPTRLALSLGGSKARCKELEERKTAR